MHRNNLFHKYDNNLKTKKNCNYFVVCKNEYPLVSIKQRQKKNLIDLKFKKYYKV